MHAVNGGDSLELELSSLIQKIVGILFDRDSKMLLSYCLIYDDPSSNIPML